jgi:hypothetical protein
MRRSDSGRSRAHASAWVRRLCAAALLGGGSAITLAGAIPAELTGLTAEISASLGAMLDQDERAAPGLGNLGRPLLGARSARGPESLLPSERGKFPGIHQALPIPAALSVVIWVRLSSGQPSQPLFGFGELQGDYLFAATDSTGAPTLSFLSGEKVAVFDRAKMGASNLADGALHAVVMVINFSSGLVRLYVDGQPESATTAVLWRPRDFGSAFALYALQGRPDALGSEEVGLLMPRIIPRELSASEIALIKPAGGESEAVSVDPELAARLVSDTLMEFWPPQFSYQLRWRPL